MTKINSLSLRDTSVHFRIEALDNRSTLGGGRCFSLSNCCAPLKKCMQKIGHLLKTIFCCSCFFRSKKSAQSTTHSSETNHPSLSRSITVSQSSEARPLSQTLFPQSSTQHNTTSSTQRQSSLSSQSTQTEAGTSTAQTVSEQSVSASTTSAPTTQTAQENSSSSQQMPSETSSTSTTTSTQPSSATASHEQSQTASRSFPNNTTPLFSDDDNAPHPNLAALLT